MRLAVVNYSNRKIGGTEHYLAALMPRLHERGVELAFVHENSQPADRDALALPTDVPCWSPESMGVDATLSAMRSWKPDLIFAHGELDPAFESRYLEIAPSVYFSHNYYGTCITGLKAFQRPEIRPCGRKFGWQCMALYYPRRCGGLNPVTMVERYRSTARRLRVLRKYGALVTHSTHLQREYLNHGFERDRVFNLKYEVSTKSTEIHRDRLDAAKSVPAPDVWKMIYVGRMERIKGGKTLLEALPTAQAQIGVPLHMSFAGDGPDRAAWEETAAWVRAQNSKITIEFHGWLKGEAFDRLIASTNLVVVPSRWPEPFGKAGLEAGLHGIPSAAFDVGGISEWLEEGVNGHLADGDPPTAAGLARAITLCLRDPRHYQDLCEGARRIAGEFNLDNHIDQLMLVFREVAARSGRRLEVPETARVHGWLGSTRLPVRGSMP